MDLIKKRAKYCKTSEAARITLKEKKFAFVLRLAKTPAPARKGSDQRNIQVRGLPGRPKMKALSGSKSIPNPVG